MEHDFYTILGPTISGCFILAANLRIHERHSRKVDEATKKVEFWAKWLSAIIEAHEPDDTVAIALARHRALGLINSAADDIDPPGLPPRPFGWKKLFVPTSPITRLEFLIRGLFYSAIGLSTYGAVLIFHNWMRYLSAGSGHHPGVMAEVGTSLLGLLLLAVLVLLAADNVETYCK